MSRSPAGRQPEVKGWLADSFDDFFGNTAVSSSTVSAKLPRSNSGRNCQQNKDPSSVPARSKSKVLPKKRTKSSSVDLPGNECRQNQSQSQDEPWVDKYKPETQNDLAVQKKKIEEVETWLKTHAFQRPPKQGGSILLLTGPPGCGKTATIQILAKDLDIQVQEWTNPISLDFTKEDLGSIFGHVSNFHMFPSQAQAAIFQDFLLRANKYNKLQMLGESSGNDKKLILIEVSENFYDNLDVLTSCCW